MKATNDEDLDKLRKLIESSGSDHLPTFGGSFEGGYCIQQSPAELALLIHSLKQYESGLNSYLQIGSAAGGTERFICEALGISLLVIIDDGNHPKFRIWNKINKPALEAQGTSIIEFIGDSHQEGARLFLNELNQKFDLIGIDGDHTHEGVLADWKLIQPLLKKNSLVWFHDIGTKLLPDGFQGAARLWADLRKRNSIILETYDDCGIGLLRHDTFPLNQDDSV
jgi:predicted O-methyltransferase YrrM